MNEPAIRLNSINVPAVKEWFCAQMSPDGSRIEPHNFRMGNPHDRKISVSERCPRLTKLKDGAETESRIFFPLGFQPSCEVVFSIRFENKHFLNTLADKPRDNLQRL